MSSRGLMRSSNGGKGSVRRAISRVFVYQECGSVESETVAFQY
jgi:hypothetical protein